MSATAGNGSTAGRFELREIRPAGPSREGWLCVSTSNVIPLAPKFSKRRRIGRKAGEYLGYIPFASAKAAMECAGPTGFWVYAMARHYRDLRKLKTVRISLAELQQDVVSRWAVKKALRLLEAERLLEVERLPGQKLAIVVFDVAMRNPPPILVERAKQRAWREYQP